MTRNEETKEVFPITLEVKTLRSQQEPTQGKKSRRISFPEWDNDDDLDPFTLN